MGTTIDPRAMPEKRGEDASPAEARIGHVHLRVSDLNRTLTFYRDLLGFGVVFYGPPFGIQAAFLASGGYHHHIALSALENAEAASATAIGRGSLDHFAILYADESALARAVTRLLTCSYRIEDARDHGATVSVYLQDPDGNPVELYYDRTRDNWFDSTGNPAGRSHQFDVNDWLTTIWSKPRQADKQK